jgi:hypothetical protein
MFPKNPPLRTERVPLVLRNGVGRGKTDIELAYLGPFPKLEKIATEAVQHIEKRWMDGHIVSVCLD